MTRREKLRFHQIHPAKLATDILTEPVSLYLLWCHQLWLGLAIVAAACLKGRVSRSVA